MCIRDRLKEINQLKDAASEAQANSQEVEKKYSQLESDMAALSEKNMEMVEKIQEYEASVAKANRKIRELEFDLKDAQKTASPTSNGTSHGKSGLGASKWATTEEETQPAKEETDGKQEDSVPSAMEGEKLSSSIAGTVRAPHFLSLVTSPYPLYFWGFGLLCLILPWSHLGLPDFTLPRGLRTIYRKFC